MEHPPPHPPKYLQRCWACSYSLFVSDGTGRRIVRALEYERVVELIEGLDGPFSITEVWHLAGPAVWNINIVRNAVRDLSYHRLIRCVKPTKNGNCLAWEKV